MELVSLVPQTGKSFLLPMEEVVLCPLGDIQYGSPGCDLPRVERHITWAEGLREKGARVYYIGMGDYVDVASPSNRRQLAAIRGELYDSVKEMLDDAAASHLERIQRLLEPTRGHWLGLLSGHHLWEFPDGTNTDSRLAQFLGTTYLGSCAYVVLRFRGHKRAADCKIWLHHGEGSGQSASAAINKVVQRVIPYWFAHLYLIGHFHTKDAKPLPWLDPYCDHRGNMRLVGTTRYIVATGGFLGGYAVGSRNAQGLPEGNYIEKAMLSPHTLGAPVIFIRPVLEHARTRVDINVSV